MDQLDRKGVFNTDSSKIYIQEDQNHTIETTRNEDGSNVKKSLISQNMHKAMSPISAIWGYLELIDMSLRQKTDVNKIRYYRDQIESGISEVNNILLQLQDVYQEAESQEPTDKILDVDLNWIISEIYKDAHLQDLKINLLTKDMPIHIKADLYIIKLVIFKLIKFSLNSSEDKSVELKTDHDGEMALFSIYFNASQSKKEDIFNEVEKFTASDKFDFSNQSTINEELETSIQLVKQVSGFINILDKGDDQAEINLSLPLSFPL